MRRPTGHSLHVGILCLGLVYAGDSVFAQGGGSNSSSSIWEDRDSDQRHYLEWFFFPPYPPALGTEVAIVSGNITTVTPEILRGFVSEPFYVPLSVRWVQVPGEAERKRLLSTEERVRLELFVSLRAALLREFFTRSTPILELPAADRLAAFQRLAIEQASRLNELEETAEWLRARLGRVDSWDKHRQWRLKRGELKQPRDKTYTLEFEVVRAAAYYWNGFLPAQRRLLREVAMEMSEVIATRNDPASRVDEFLMLFSPETTRIPRPGSASRELTVLITRYEEEKRRLKEELRDTIYEFDGSLTAYTRHRRIEELATSQKAPIAALDGLAEDIRRQLVHVPDYRRFRGPQVLNAELVARLKAFVDETVSLYADRSAFVEERIRKRGAAAPPAGEGAKPEEPRESRARARALWEVENGERVMAREHMAEELLVLLTEALPIEEAERLNGPPDLAITDYLYRRDEAEAYAEYDLATIEPGLSPAQRRLLLASAMARLRLVMPPPVRQPVYAPATLFGIGS